MRGVCLPTAGQRLEYPPCGGAVDGAQVEELVSGLQDKVLGKWSGASDALLMIIEAMKMDVRRKTTRNDVMRLIAASLKEMGDVMRVPDDTLMAGTSRCLACNSLGGMTKSAADPVYSGALPMVPSTYAPSASGISFNSSTDRTGKRPNPHQLILASYPNGRGGALRPLQTHASPMVPVQGAAARRAKTAGAGSRRGTKSAADIHALPEGGR